MVKTPEQDEDDVEDAICLDGIRSTALSRDLAHTARSQRPIEFWTLLPENLSVVIVGNLSTSVIWAFTTYEQTVWEGAVMGAKKFMVYKPNHCTFSEAVGRACTKGFLDTEVHDLQWWTSETPFRQTDFLFRGMVDSSSLEYVPVPEREFSIPQRRI